MWIVRRLAAAVPVLFGVSLVTFFLLDSLPGSAARQLLGADATPEQVRALEEDLGLDSPVAERYARWISRAVVGDLGQSIASSQKVAALLLERLPVTLQLVVFALIMALAIALPCAVLAARYPDQFADRVILASSMLFLSVPTYVFALLLVFVFAVHLGLLPAIGYVSPSVSFLMAFKTLLLPALAIALPLAGLYTRVLRADLLRKMAQEDYVAMAIANGAGPWRVIFRHALRNSASNLVTLVALNLGVLIGGTVVIEQVFALPGMGRLLLQAVNGRDAPVVQGVVLTLSVSIVLATVIADIICRIIDPRTANESRVG